jgi:predicted site-specific integrase-resolvase
MRGNPVDGMLKANEVAQLLKIGVNTILLWSKLGIFKSYRLGHNGKRGYKRDDLVSFLIEDEDGQITHPKEIKSNPGN